MTASFVRRRVLAALAAGEDVNVTGPVGVGKSHAVTGIPGARIVDVTTSDRTALSDPGITVLDGVDGPGRVRGVRDALRHAEPGGPVVLVSRRPLRASREWTDLPLTQVAVPLLSADALAGLLGTLDEPGRELALRLAGGVPAVAESVVRALLADPGDRYPPAVADFVVTDLADRLTRELPGKGAHILRLLAAVGAADERIIGGTSLFTAVADASFVHRTPAGLVVGEPWRTLLDLAFRWRDPQRHRAARARTAGYRLRQLEEPVEAVPRAAVVEQALSLTENSAVREVLFPQAAAFHVVRTATAADADGLGALLRAWALQRGFDPVATERVTDRWIAEDVAGFQVAVDPDGRLSGLIRICAIDPATIDLTEPVLQQHTEAVVTELPGCFTGATYCPDETVRAQLLRVLLRAAVAGEGVVVSTAGTDFTRVMAAVGFTDHGETRSDVFRCGRPPSVYSLRTRGHDLPAWIRTLLGNAGTVTAEMVAAALARIGDAVAFADSALVAQLATAPDVVATRLRTGIERLLAGPGSTDVEAGRILTAYYLRNASSHHAVARTMHLSRATYFRRLRHGLDRITTELLATVPPA